VLTTPESQSSAQTEASEATSDRSAGGMTTPLLSQASSTSSSRPDLSTEVAAPGGGPSQTTSKSPPKEEDDTWHTVAKPAPHRRERSRDFGDNHDKHGKSDKADWHRRDASNPRTGKGGSPLDRPTHRRTRSSGAAAPFSNSDKGRSRAPDTAWGKATSSGTTAAAKEAKPANGAWGKSSSSASKPTFAQLLQPEDNANA
jgi:hypothetical protein